MKTSIIHLFLCVLVWSVWVPFILPRLEPAGSGGFAGTMGTIAASACLAIIGITIIGYRVFRIVKGDLVDLSLTASLLANAIAIGICFYVVYRLSAT